MATLAPTIPQGSDPEYLRYSRPITQPEGSKAGAILGKGIGDAAEEGLKGIDKVVGTYAENKAYDEGQKARQAEEERIDPIWRELTGQGAAQNDNSEVRATQFQPTELDGSQSLIQKNQDLPPEIRFGTRTAGALNERFNNGKMSQTDYKSEVDRIAKDLNSQFPLWRNEISRGLERATGVAGADAMIRSKIEDINRIMSQLQEQKNKINTKILSATDKMPPDAISKLYDDYNSGRKNDAQVLHDISNFEYPDTVIKRAESRINLNKALRGEAQYKAGTDVDDVLGGVSLKHMNSVLVKNGVSTPNELIEKLQQGRLDPNDPLMLQVSSQLRNAFDAEEREMRQALAPHRAALGGQGEVEKKINEHMAYHKEILSQLADPAKAGNAVTAALQDTQAVERNLGNWISKDPVGRKLMLLKKMNELTPDLATKMNENALANEKEFGPSIGRMINKFNSSSLAINPTDINNKPSTARKDAEALIGAGADPKAMKSWIGFANKLTERSLPDDQAYNLAKYFFGKDNVGLVGKWARDLYNPNTGKTSEGQVNVLKMLGSPEIANKIYELADKGHPDIRDDYRNFMEHAFSFEIFPNILGDMKDVSIAAGDRLGYSPKDMHFHLDTKPGTVGATSTYVRSTIQRLNYSLDVLREVAKHENRDPNSYLLQLIQAGNPDAFSKEVKGFPSDINKAIGNQTLAKEIQKKKEEEAMTKAKKMSE